MIGKKKRDGRLAASVQFHTAVAGRQAAIAANGARAESIQAGAQGSSREGITAANIVEEKLRVGLPGIFAAYTEERSALLLDDPRLKRAITKGIEQMFDEARSLLPDVPAFGLSRQIYRDQIDEGRVRALADAEEHFRRPGLKPLIQRFGAQASALGFVGGALFTWALTWLGARLTAP